MPVKSFCLFEGLAGVSYSVPEQILKITGFNASCLGVDGIRYPHWQKNEWTKIRFERNKTFFGGKQKKITVEDSPFPLKIDVWLDEKELAGKPSLMGAAFKTLSGERNNSISIMAEETADLYTITVPLK